LYELVKVAAFPATSVAVTVKLFEFTTAVLKFAPLLTGPLHEATPESESEQL
jgi:hypothetical protein